MKKPSPAKDAARAEKRQAKAAFAATYAITLRFAVAMSALMGLGAGWILHGVVQWAR